MAKWLRDYLSFGGRRPPPQPPTPDYSDSDILRAYRAQKNLDFEDPYEDAESRVEPEPAGPADCKGPGGDAKYDSPKHRLIKVEAADMARAKALLGDAGEEAEVDTEYSDPFDARPHRPSPDDGYMEPYDAQRVLSELPCRGVQLYDTPYEEQDQGTGDGPPSGQKPQQSRLPQEDERPAEEYDQPWEWKKDHISRAFAVQFDSPDWERTPGSAKELRRPPPRSPQPAERVDPALPLEKQPSSQGFLHLKFARTRENQVVLGQHSGPFASVPELVLHYSSRPLPVQGAEHLALLYPVAAQTP
uniref:Src homology 2 domain containing transforming protein D n=1 Tax=Microcebus murinus TaxID=30608 RepID=A0A8C5VEF1_MICMU